jgi:hypothetical protein
MGDKFVAVGEGTNQIAYSTNGESWIGVGNNYFTNRGLSVNYNGEIIVAGGNGNNTTTFAIWSSTDGINWIPRTQILLTQINGIAFNNTWLLVGTGTNTAIRSTDLNSYTAVTNSFTTTGNSVFSNNVYFVAVGNGNIKYSLDGVSFTDIASGGFSTSGSAVTWSGKSWVAVGDNNVVSIDIIPENLAPTTWFNTTNISMTTINGIAGNPKTLGIASAITINNSETLALCTPAYYNAVNKSMSVSL